MFVKFKPKIKEKIVAALRSGEYKQAFRKMKVDDCFCVEGVIADLYQKSVEKPYNFNRIFADADVWEWATGEVTGCGPIYDYCGVNRSLLDLNDGIRLSFEQIADIIEKE